MAKYDCYGTADLFERMERGMRAKKEEKEGTGEFLLTHPVSRRRVVTEKLCTVLLQVELAGICFGISAFLRRGSLGIGLGLAAVMYFLNLIANISDSARSLKYLTPYAYTEGADIVASGGLDTELVLLGLLYGVIGVAAAYGKFCRKDIR